MAAKFEGQKLFDIKVTGLQELVRRMEGLPDALTKQAIGRALEPAGEMIRDAIKPAVPVLRRPNKYRTPGLVRDLVVVRSSKRDAAAGNVGVFVRVKPAHGAEKGAKSPRDPYYWRLLNRGTKKPNAFGVVMSPVQFMQRGVAVLPRAVEMVEAGIAAEIKKLDLGT